ncbi:restriction endonuclease, partial [Actinobacillus seminis]
VVKASSLERKDNSSKNKENYKKVEKNDIAYNSMRMWQGASGVSMYSGILSPAYTVLIPLKSIDPIFFSYYFKLEKMLNVFQANSQGLTSDTWNLKYPVLKTILVNVPCLEEQTAIGNFFKQLDDTIALHQRTLEKYQKLKISYLEKMFPKENEQFPELRFPNFTDAWEQRKLGDLGYPFTGLSGKTKNDFGHGKAKFITYLNVFNNPISNVNELEQIEIDIKQNSVQYGDILFTTSSETPNEVGMSSVWLDKTENIYLNSFCFGYRLNVKIDPFFLAFLLRSPSIRKKFILLAQGISRYNISRNKVMEMSICLPCLEEQTAIGNFFKQLDDTIALHQREVDKYKKIKQAYLEKMFV